MSRLLATESRNPSSPDVHSLACAVLKVNVELNLFPRNSTRVRNRADDCHSRCGFRITEDNLTLGNVNLVLVGFVILARVKNAGESKQHRSHRQAGKTHPERRMEYNHRPTILKVKAMRTFPCLLRNLHAAHLASLRGQRRVHTMLTGVGQWRIAPGARLPTDKQSARLLG